jgi:hypothetical protein
MVGTRFAEKMTSAITRLWKITKGDRTHTCEGITKNANYYMESAKMSAVERIRTDDYTLKQCVRL